LVKEHGIAGLVAKDGEPIAIVRVKPIVGGYPEVIEVLSLVLHHDHVVGHWMG
jgi:hypothetical protein